MPVFGWRTAAMASGVAVPLNAGTASAVASERAATTGDEPCGVFTGGDGEYYRNCDDRSVRIRVERVFTPDDRCCVPPHGTIPVDDRIGAPSPVVHVEGHGCQT
ncbi:DUF6355 family natural product biosynthesis protein [Streptosporangium canum]|uniref:DUF6355 family natural product biosynthesis protein n=1 Tax=Streptosporangium canum TaxID=324952 RepID=UPI003438C519